VSKGSSSVEVKQGSSGVEVDVKRLFGSSADVAILKGSSKRSCRQGGVMWCPMLRLEELQKFQ
jgi:hypothetical protein